MWKGEGSFPRLAGPLQAIHERRGTGQPWKVGTASLDWYSMAWTVPMRQTVGKRGRASPVWLPRDSLALWWQAME